MSLKLSLTVVMDIRMVGKLLCVDGHDIPADSLLYLLACTRVLASSNNNFSFSRARGCPVPTGGNSPFL